MYSYDRNSPDALRRYFSGLAEYAFNTRLGLADPPLVEYLSQLLSRFLRTDTIYSVRNLSGRRLDAVADMLAEANARIGEAKRQVHRHIGDFTLFWTGVYPEVLAHMKRGPRKDSFSTIASKASEPITSPARSPAPTPTRRTPCSSG